MSLVTTVPSGAMRNDSGTTGDAESDSNPAVRILEHRPGTAFVVPELADGVEVVSEHDTNHTCVADRCVALGEGDQLGVLLAARDTPGCEEVDENPPATEAR